MAKGKKSIWKKVAVGAGSGILLGSVATLLSASAPLGHAEGENAEEEGSETHPEWTDGEVSVASSVSDDMSFSEAFSGAEATVRYDQMVELSLPEVSEAMPRDGASHRGVEILITS